MIEAKVLPAIKVLNMAEKVRKITEGTLIPLSMVFSMAGGIIWLTTLHNKTQEIEKAVARIESNQELAQGKMLEVITKLSTIEGKLGSK